VDRLRRTGLSTIESRTQSERSVVVVVLFATGAREARGGRRGGLSVPKPPKGEAVAVAGLTAVGHGHDHVYGHDLLR